MKVSFTTLLACASGWLIFGLALGSLEPDTAGDSDIPLAERQVRTALELRSRKDATSRQLQQAASLLKAAAGVSIAESGKEVADNTLLPSSNTTEIYPGIRVSNSSNTKALKTLSYIYSQEGQGLPFNPRAAFELLKHAARSGDSEAQREWGLLLAVGATPPQQNSTPKLLFELGDRNWPEALLHLYFAASMNDSVAQMALGYRHMHGLGVPKSCPTAVLYYQAVAERVTDYARYPYSYPRIERVLLSSQVQSGGPPSREQELLHYQWFADMGYVDAQRTVGRLLAQGSPQQAQNAMHYFKQAAQAEDGDAMAQLGHMYANGIGVAASNATAVRWFRLGSERGNPSAHFGLGYMYLRGYGLPQDYRLAIKFLTAAAEQGHPEAWFHLGTVHLNGWGVAVSLQQAQTFFGMAAKAGHVLAQYNLAMIYLRGRGSTNCDRALERLKSVAERGPWAAILQDASDAFAEGRHDWALLGYLKASEAGYELAQANAAWMLSHDFGIPPEQSARSYVEAGQKPAAAALTAIRAHQRASQQGNVDSILAIGDAFYYGRGVSRDWPTAFQVYSAAARFRNAQALFNLGFMHEYGAGVPEDLALAKRNYDKAKELMPGATAPVQLALISLWLHGCWDGVKPFLPASLDWLWDSMFKLHQPSRVMRPAGSYLPKPSLSIGGIDRLAAAANHVAAPIGTVLFRIFVHPYQARDEGAMLDAELLETLMLIILIGCLWLVVWRRMSLRTTRRQQGEPPPEAPFGTEAAAQPPAANQPGRASGEGAGEARGESSSEAPSGGERGAHVGPPGRDTTVGRGAGVTALVLGRHLEELERKQRHRWPLPSTCHVAVAPAAEAVPVSLGLAC